MKKWVVVYSIVLLVLSCKSKKTDYCIVPKEIFVEMLTETQLVDGYYNYKYYETQNHNDTLNFYFDIYRKYGYDKSCFDSTFRYYTDKPDKFEKIYEDVITNLTVIEQELNRKVRLQQDSTKNLFNKSQKWYLPLHGRTNKIPFEIKLQKNDTLPYTILVQIQFLDHDATVNPRLTAYFWHLNGTKEGRRQYFPTVAYKKTKRIVMYSTECRPNSKHFTYLRGFLIDSDNENDFKHIKILSIEVYRHKNKLRNN